MALYAKLRKNCYGFRSIERGGLLMVIEILPFIILVLFLKEGGECVMDSKMRMEFGVGTKLNYHKWRFLSINNCSLLSLP